VLPFDASQDSQGYTYLVPEHLASEIRIGQLVQVPLREHEVQGIVAGLSRIPGDADVSELKEVDAILQAMPLFQPEQVATMLRYAEKHAIHIHKVVALFLPAPIRNRILKYGLEPVGMVLPESEPSESPLPEPRSPQDSERDTDAVPNGRTNPPELCFFLDSERLVEAARKLLETPGVAIIVPSDIFTQKILAGFAGKPESVGIFDSGMTETAKSKSWIDTLRKKYDSVI
jgi:primosomal protein N'